MPVFVHARMCGHMRVHVRRRKAERRRAGFVTSDCLPWQSGLGAGPYPRQGVIPALVLDFLWDGAAYCSVTFWGPELPPQTVVPTYSS